MKLFPAPQARPYLASKSRNRKLAPWLQGLSKIFLTQNNGTTTLFSLPFQLALSPMTIYCTSNNDYAVMNYVMVGISASTILLPIAILLKQTSPNWGAENLEEDIVSTVKDEHNEESSDL